MALPWTRRRQQRMCRNWRRNELLFFLLLCSVAFAQQQLHDGGPKAYKVGLDLFTQRDFQGASTELWKAVIWHGDTPPDQKYDVQDAFTKFLQCYVAQDRLVDGLCFVSSESFRRGQNDMGHTYLKQALQVDPNHEEALRIQAEYASGGNKMASASTMKMAKQSTATTTKKKPMVDDDDDEDSAVLNPDLEGISPEALYDTASRHFADKNYEICADLFEISCRKSGNVLGPSCANAVYCRSLVVDWGLNGSLFDADMERIQSLTAQEVASFRIPSQLSESNNDFAWKRSTSVHPHMMLAYPLPGLIKRYVAESVAYMDEQMARLDTSKNPQDASRMPELPSDMPFDHSMENSLIQQELATTSSNTRLRVGFVGCGFNSKAVLYLSHDMFRFFDYSRFEIHVFSFGAPDNALFIQHGMRGVDWRQRVINYVDVFHDMRNSSNDHVAAARYIYNQRIHILIEWDGYARQGERAQGLFALRPAPLQILHQEYLGTSGATYVDYIVSDQVASPPHLQHLYTEKILYLPNHFFSKGHAYQHELVPPRHEYLPYDAKKGYVLGRGSPQQNKCLAKGTTSAPSFVFCNFNKFLKNNPETMRSWLAILKQVPDAWLCLLENPKEGIPYLRRFVYEATATRVVNDTHDLLLPTDDDLNARIHFLPWQRNPFDHQQRNHDFCNVMLDSYPYNGHTVAQDALYAGVPIVTRSDGDDMCSRVTTSANIVLGLDEHLNAQGGVADYESKAIKLARNVNLYQSLRRQLVDSALQRNPMHPYWDVARYVKNFQTGLTMAWEEWRQGKPLQHLYVSDAREGTFDEEILAHPPDGVRGDKTNTEKEDSSEHNNNEGVNNDDPAGERHEEL